MPKIKISYSCCKLKHDPTAPSLITVMTGLSNLTEF